MNNTFSTWTARRSKNVLRTGRGGADNRSYQSRSACHGRGEAGRILSKSQNCNADHEPQAHNDLQLNTMETQLQLINQAVQLSIERQVATLVSQSFERLGPRSYNIMYCWVPDSIFHKYVQETRIYYTQQIDSTQTLAAHNTVHRVKAHSLPPPLSPVEVSALSRTKACGSAWSSLWTSRSVLYRWKLKRTEPLWHW